MFKTTYRIYKSFPTILAFGAGYYTSEYLKKKVKLWSPTKADQQQVDDNKSLKNKILDHGAGIIQNFAPINGIHVHVCGFHGYSGEMNRQVLAHHYCSHLNEDVHQCVIYESDKPNARLIGIEYIVSQRIFENLPTEEKKLWHSHIHEVKGGLLTAPGLPQIAENQLMANLVNTYGKTFHFWQVDRGDDLPYGLPKLMMAFTNDSQLNKETLQIRDQQSQSMMESRKKRADIKEPTKDKMADNWEHGQAIVIDSKEVPYQFESKK